MFWCNLLLVKGLVWMFQFLQTGSPHRSLPRHLCCLLLYRITVSAGWSSLQVVPKCKKFLISFHCFPNTGDSHSPMSSMHFYTPIPSNCLCEVSSEVLCCVLALFFSFLYHRCSSLSVFILCWRSQQPGNLSHKKAYPFSHLLPPWICDTWLMTLSHLTECRHKHTAVKHQEGFSITALAAIPILLGVFPSLFLQEPWCCWHQPTGRAGMPLLQGCCCRRDAPIAGMCLCRDVPVAGMCLLQGCSCCRDESLPAPWAPLLPQFPWPRCPLPAAPWPQPHPSGHFGLSLLLCEGKWEIRRGLFMISVCRSCLPSQSWWV